MTSRERNNKINALLNLENGEIGILSNARCLSEGVDVPTLDGIAFIDPRSSQVDIIQAVGRAIRKSESKSYGYIILPVYLGDTENISEELLASRFKDVWEIILALKSQDDSLTEILDQLRVELGKRGERVTTAEGLTKIICDFPERVEHTIGDSFQTVLVRSTTDNWNEIYGQLLRFVEQEGHAKPRIDHPVLGIWTNTQRQNYRMGTLLNKRRLLLEELIPKGWVWNTIEGRQEKWVEEIKGFSGRNGHLNIPDSDKEVGGIAKMIRHAYSGKQKYSLNQSTIDALNGLRDKGWMWDVSKEILMEKIQFLKEWCIKNQSVTPPRSTRCTGNLRTYSNTTKTNTVELGNLVNLLRQRYQLTMFRNDPEYRDEFSPSVRAKPDLDIDVIRAVESIPGWYWDSWDGFSRVYKRCGDEGISIKDSTVVDFDFKELQTIGTWVRKMRGRALRGELKTHQIVMIESLPGWTYEPHHDKFMKGIDSYITYAKERPNKDIPQSYIDENGFKLGSWVSVVRMNKKKRPLSQNPLYAAFYERLLDSYGFPWTGNHPNRWSVD